jgi:hypothetical protein
MKLLLENWKKYLNEDIEEGIGQKLAMTAAMLGGLAGSPDVKADNTNSSAQTHQADSNMQVNTLIDNNDGSYSIITPANPAILNLSNRGMADDILKTDGRRALSRALKGSDTSLAKITYLDSNFQETGTNIGSNPQRIKYIKATGNAK